MSIFSGIFLSPVIFSHQYLSVTHIGLCKPQALGHRSKKKCMSPKKTFPEIERVCSPTNRTNLETHHTGARASVLWSMGTEQLIFNPLLSCAFLYPGGNLFDKCQAEGGIYPVPIFARVGSASLVYSRGAWDLSQGSLGWALVKQTPFAPQHTHLARGWSLLLQSSAPPVWASLALISLLQVGFEERSSWCCLMTFSLSPKGILRSLPCIPSSGLSRVCDKSGHNSFHHSGVPSVLK